MSWNTLSNMYVVRVNNFISAKRIDILSLAILVTTTLITRLILFMNSENLYYVDCYNYLNNAILISEGEVLQFSRGYPFFLVLGAMVKVTDGLVDPVTSAELFMILCNVALIIVMYLLSKQILSAALAFFATLFASIETNLIFYSLVPYLEIFAYLAGFCSLYVIASRFSKLDAKHILIGLILCAVSVFTRFELLIVFALPLVTIALIYGIMHKGKRKAVTLIFILLGISIFLLYPQFESYYLHVTRFTPIERIFLSLRWDVWTNAFNLILSISGNELLDMIFKAVCLFGFLYLVVAKAILPLTYSSELCRSKSISLKRLASYFHDKARLTSFSLIVSFVILLVITVAYYSVSYTITNGKLILSSIQINARFLIGTQLYLSWVFVYSIGRLLKIPTVFRRIGEINLKTRIGSFALNTHRLYVLFLALLLFLWIPGMWINGFNRSREADQTMGLYRKTSQWLVANLEGNSVAIVPVEVVFHVLNPELRNRTVPYKLFWDKAEVAIRADNTVEEYYMVQEQLINFIKENNSAGYVVVDWMDAYCKPILYYSLGVNEELSQLLHKVHEEAVIRPNQWVPRIRIYEIAKD